MNQTITDTYFPKLENVNQAVENIKEICQYTPLQFNFNLSSQYGASVYLKREDLQVVRSYKIRGAYNKIVGLSDLERENGIICASAGNHAQGVALACNKLNIKGFICMPETTPKQKISQVKLFGKDHVEVILNGDSYDDSYEYALKKAKKDTLTFIHPFDDQKIIEGQATIALEILHQMKDPIDYLILPVGGGGLASGVGSMFKELSPGTKIIGVETQGAPAMYESLKKGQKTRIEKIDRFADGVAVHEVGDITFSICKEVIDSMVLVPEGLICSVMLKLYNEDAMVVEPAGTLAMAALKLLKDEVKNKNVVCLVSGSNNDIFRFEEIKERSLLYEGLKHYFIISFPQRAGALKEFANNVLNKGDDITFFEYSKKHNREKGPAVIGIELFDRDNLKPLLENLDRLGFEYEYLNDKPQLFQYLV